jgi:hypothetical protein
MKMFSINLGNRGGELSVVAKPNVAKNECTFQAVVNGLPVFEGYDYEDAREVVMNVFELNTIAKEELN